MKKEDLTYLKEITLRMGCMVGLIEMNKKERERLKVMIRLESKTLSQDVAAKQLGIGIRQVQRLLKAYREKGDSALLDPKRKIIEIC